MTRSRAFCFTWNNYTQKDWESLKLLRFKYLVMSKEVGASGTPHIQGYVCFDSAKTLSATIKLMKGAHVEIAIRSAEKNKDYITKDDPIDDDFYEDGDVPKQGQRVDLEAVAEEVRNGETTVGDILVERPMVYHQFGRTLRDLEDELLNRFEFNNVRPHCLYLHGPTGTGKSYRAFENYHWKTHYVWKDDQGWQDGYKRQETVIINEFRGEIKFKQMLEITDSHPTFIRRRGRCPIPFTSKRIIITSALHPKDIYTGLAADDKLEQLLDRIEIVFMGGPSRRNKDKS